MSACPNGHDVDEGLQYCEECGARATGAPATAAAAAPPPPRSWLCRHCHTTQSHSRFCEACGEPNPEHPDFAGTDIGTNPAPPTPTEPVRETAPPVPQAAPTTAATAIPDLSPPASDTTSQPLPPTADQAPTSGWTITAAADREYFSRIQGFAGPDAGGIQFPVVYPPRRFELTGEQIFIGRRSRSRGIEPDIDLSGAPLDPGVSHSHAAIVATDDGGWAVVDVGSSNGTYLNGSTEPIAQGTPHKLADGDHIQLGAWTRLTVSRT